MPFGLSSGISVTAVSTLSVLAGPNSPCGSLAASTWPVFALAMTHADDGIWGSGLAPAGSLTTTPRLAISGPPMRRAARLPGLGGLAGCVVSAARPALAACAGRSVRAPGDASRISEPAAATRATTAAGQASTAGQARAVSAVPAASAASDRAPKLIVPLISAVSWPDDRELHAGRAAGWIAAWVAMSDVLRNTHCDLAHAHRSCHAADSGRSWRSHDEPAGLYESFDGRRRLIGLASRYWRRQCGGRERGALHSRTAGPRAVGLGHESHVGIRLAN